MSDFVIAVGDGVAVDVCLSGGVRVGKSVTVGAGTSAGATLGGVTQEIKSSKIKCIIDLSFMAVRTSMA